MWHLWLLIAFLQCFCICYVNEEKKPFKCDYTCSQKIASVHEGKNPLKCDIFDYSRYQKTNMNRHVKDINEEKKGAITVQNITCIKYCTSIFHFIFNVLCIYTRSNLIYTLLTTPIFTTENKALVKRRLSVVRANLASLCWPREHWREWCVVELKLEMNKAWHN
jgi:hypothetical protein